MRGKYLDGSRWSCKNLLAFGPTSLELLFDLFVNSFTEVRFVSGIEVVIYDCVICVVKGDAGLLVNTVSLTILLETLRLR